MLDRVLRFVRTIRHLRPTQLVGRVAYELRRRLARRGIPTTFFPTVPSDLSGAITPDQPFLTHEPWNRTDDLLAGRFVFLNCGRDLGRPVDWRAPGASLLWRYNLHYFDYLHLVDPPRRDQLCREWVAANPVGRTVGWDPYPTARRIVSWVKADPRSHRVVRSLYRQASFLFRNVEEHILGNHILANAKALLFAGLRFAGRGEADRWKERAFGILRREIPEQVLADGGHFERSPMYHSIVLRDLLDMVNVLQAGEEIREVLESAAARMIPFLRAVTHPDGRLALFNDSSVEIAPPTSELLDYAQSVVGPAAERGVEETTSGEFRASGYYTHRNKSSYLIIDAGEVGPDYLPAHAHADIFSYELSLAGCRIVVDRGCSEYEAGQTRNEERATRSHNTVEVDCTSQAECWKSFRVARRYPPREVRFRQGPHEAVLEGCFDGYSSLIGDGIRHCRKLRFSAADRQLLVEDVVLGEGRHVMESRIRLHPQVQVHHDAGDLQLSRAGVSCRIQALAGQAVPAVEGGLYSPEFGLTKQTSVLSFRLEGELPLRTGYRLTYSLADGDT